VARESKEASSATRPGRNNASEPPRGSRRRLTNCSPNETPEPRPRLRINAVPDPITRLEAVAAGLGSLAEELMKLYGEPTPNLLYWRQELLDVVDEMAAGVLPDPGADRI
jgi:hypothetical protein